MANREQASNWLLRQYKQEVEMNDDVVMRLLKKTQELEKRLDDASTLQYIQKSRLGDLQMVVLGNVVAIGYDAITGERGLLTKGINRTGHTSIKGELVSTSTSADDEYILQANEYDTVAVVAESGIAQGAEMWLWKPGSRALVLLKNTTAATRGQILIAADTDGRGIGIANPGGGLPGTDTHFKECGHILQSKLAGTNVLVLCELHTN
jgi:hypothetical protein